MSDLPLTPPVFAILSALIEERAGLSFSMDDKDLLADKLSARAIEVGFDSLLDYYYFLRYDPNNERELQALINALVVNETFFFREFPQVDFLVSDFIVPLVREGRRPRIWSAACSTGEEPLTIAMLLAEHGVLEQVEIVATDISGSALARAQKGEHSRRSLRHVPVPALAAKWLEVSADRVVTSPVLRQAIRWSRMNLLEPESMLALGQFDCILCRNVLIYFKDTTVVRVVTQLSKQLHPDGLLLVGVSESLMRFGTALTCEERSGVFVYRRAEER
jgi:chemotaxis protein methyltransferase CheR